MTQVPNRPNPARPRPPTGQHQPIQPDPLTTVEMTRKSAGNLPPSPAGVPGARPATPAMLGRPVPAQPARPVVPATPATSAPSTAIPANQSGISSQKPGATKDYGLTATVTLSRSGMGMMQKKKMDLPPPNQRKFSIATETSVKCPQCQTEFPITPEVWGAIAECTECGCEFEIRAPATAKPTIQAAVPAAPAAAVATPAAAHSPRPVPPAAAAAHPAPPAAAASRSIPAGAKPNTRTFKSSRQTSTAMSVGGAKAGTSAKKGSNSTVVILSVAVVLLVLALVGVLVVLLMK